MEYSTSVLFGILTGLDFECLPIAISVHSGLLIAPA